MSTLKASKQGLAKIKQQRTEMGWPVGDHRWLKEASQVLGINWEENGYLAEGISEGTWSRFLAGQRINAPAFKAYCQILKLNWKEVAHSIERQDWGSAPDVSVFYDRREELDKLEQWIVRDRCRLVALLGMGGIGKTTLSVRCGQQIQDEFEYIIWRSLTRAPTLENLLANLIQFLPNQHQNNLPSTLEGRVLQLMECLRQHRCLLVLDAWETVLQSGEQVGPYLEGFEGYGEFLKWVGERPHNSCLVLTSREKPKEIAELEGRNRPVRSLQLHGLGEAARGILRDKDLSDQEDWEELINSYRGNPLALKIVSTTIQDLFSGRVSEFLNNTLFLGDFEYLLFEQFNRLSDLEKEIMYYIAITQKPTTRTQLREQIQLEVSSSELLKALQSLFRRSIIEKLEEGDETLFTLPPIVMSYVNKQYRHANYHK